MSPEEDVYYACRISSTLFALNPYLAQQNFYSQQLRALALVEVINELHLKPGSRNICVVGAGIGGRMLAAAFVSVGATVRIIEARETPFERYRNAIHRELHPNIIFWPTVEPTPATALPFLNWGQAPVKDVTADLLDEWNQGFGRKVDLVNGELTALQHDARGVQLTLQDGRTVSADLCVLAMGFKPERQVGRLTSPSYWSPNAVADENKAVLVSGSGDGGLIDVLSPILGTDVTRAAHLLAAMLSKSHIKEDVAEVERVRASSLIFGTRDSEAPCLFYENVSIPPEAVGRVQSFAASNQQLKGRSITFLHKSTSPYSFAAAPINKLLLGHFSSPTAPYVKSVKGDITFDAGRHCMECADGSSESLDPPSKFDKVIIRHGAEPGIVDVLSVAELEVLKLRAKEHPGATVLNGYNRELYNWSDNGLKGSGMLLETMVMTLRRVLRNIGRAYKIDIIVGKISKDCFYSGNPVEVYLSKDDLKYANELELFPMQIGPATVNLQRPDIRRNAPYEIDT